MKKTPKQKNYRKANSVNFHFDSYPSKKENGRVKVSLAVCVKGKTEYYPISPAVFMYRKFWVPAHDNVTGKKLGYNVVNSIGNPDFEKSYPILVESKREMEELIARIAKKKKGVTHRVLKSRWGLEDDLFWKAFLIYCEARYRGESDTFDRKKRYVKKRKLWDRSYYLKGLRVAKSIRTFSPDLNLTEVTWDWVADYQEYLEFEHPNESTGTPGLGQNTVAGHIAMFSTFFKIAKLREEIEENPYTLFMDSKQFVGRADGQPNPLEQAEVMALLDAYRKGTLKDFRYTTPKGRQKHFPIKFHGYLQLILISCFSGLRHSDLKRFVTGDNFMVREENGKLYLDFQMKKGEKRHIVLAPELLKEVLPGCSRKNLVLKKIGHHSTMNRNLRFLLSHMGIETYHKWHDLRATFGNLVRDNSNDEKGASEAMGHTSVSISRKYYFKPSSQRANKAVASLDKLAGKAIPNEPVQAEELQYEIQMLEMLNPGLVLPPKLKKWLNGGDEVPQVGNSPKLKVV